MNILGISGFYHDSAAALVQDGVVVAAAQEAIAWERWAPRQYRESQQRTNARPR